MQEYLETPRKPKGSSAEEVSPLGVQGCITTGLTKHRYI